MESYNYVIWRRVHRKIFSYYTNAARKYFNTYSFESMKRHIINAENSITFIEDGLQRRKPTLNRWQGLYMAHAKDWYFAYRIKGDTIEVVDACHTQNMHN